MNKNIRLLVTYYSLMNKGNKGKIREISPNLKEENIGTYEIKKNIFGKEKVRKVKDENRNIGIEYTPQR